MKLLLLEDDERLARSLTRALRLLGHAVVLARSEAAGEGAFTSEGAFDAVVADLKLEDGGSGLKFLSWVAQAYPQCIRVLATAAQCPPEFQAHGRQAFVSKPFDPEELHALLVRFLSTGSPPRG